MKYFFSILLCLPFLLVSQNKLDSSIEPDSFYSPLKYRCIGPFRGGRSVCASGVVGNNITYYMGTTGGGLWKTTDAGQHWRNISDGFFKTGSVGAVAVSESNPNVIYVGMGEHAPRAVMTSHGDGIYKSSDAGKTWTHLGLEKTQHISRIIIDPLDNNIIYVAAQGALYGPNRERGIYKSTDAGKTWENILFVNNLTGCAELSMDMQNPQVIYAAMWEHQRKPWKVISGGKGSGLYKTTDAGKTWKKIHKGLPTEKGKMAIAVARSNSEKVYALIESDTQKDKSGLFVSNNGGDSWSKVSGDNRLTQRAWYYIELFINPQNENEIYVLSAPALKSIDGGKTWSRISGTHGDFHDLWINPDNPKNMVIANDGGAAISFDNAKTWSTQSNMPTAQFYRLNVDNQFPYRIYAGQQDNSSISIAHRELNSRSITPHSWTYSAGGESAFLAFNPDKPDFVMGGSYLGTIEYLDTKAQAGTDIMSAPIQYLGMEARDMKYLYNWNAPIIRSVHEENTFYHGAQLLLKTKDNGVSWEEVSPDLTRNQDTKQGNGGGPYTNEAVGAENYGTLSYVVESQHEAGVIWTGSDDGYVQITKDNGATWTNVTPKNLKECLINTIEVSPHDPATAYIATTRYKFDDKTPGLYKTTNYGKTWQNISSNIPQGAYTRVVREDEKQKDLLFAGTETGVYLSKNGGQKWQPLQLNLPITPILDLLLKHDDIIIATSGRSFWILDDLELLRQNASKKNIDLFQPADVYLANGGSQLDGNSSSFDGTNVLAGVNPASGAVLYYHLPVVHDSLHLKMEIFDENNKLINSFTSVKDKTYRRYGGGPPSTPTLSKKKGLNRFVWNLRHKTMPGIPTAYIEASYRGHKASPGSYKVVLTYDNNNHTTQFNILKNPLYPADIDYKSYDTYMTEMESELTTMHNMTNDIFKKRNQLEKLIGEIDKDDKDKLKELIEKANALTSKMKTWDEEMVQRKSQAYDDVENFPNKFTAHYMYVINQTESDIPRLTKGSKDRRAELEMEWQKLKITGNAFLEKEIPEMNQLLWKNGFGAIWE